MNTNFFYKCILFSAIIFCMSCGSAKKVSENTKKADFLSNTEAYFKSNTPPKTMVPFETEEAYEHRTFQRTSKNNADKVFSLPGKDSL